MIDLSIDDISSDLRGKRMYWSTYRWISVGCRLLKLRNLTWILYVILSSLIRIRDRRWDSGRSVKKRTYDRDYHLEIGLISNCCWEVIRYWVFFRSFVEWDRHNMERTKRSTVSIANYFKSNETIQQAKNIMKAQQHTKRNQYENQRNQHQHMCQTKL